MAELPETPVAPPSRQTVQRPAQKPEGSAETGLVFCKLPNGLRLRLHRLVEQREPVMGGGSRKFTIAEPIAGQEFLLNGGGEKPFRIGDPSTHEIRQGFGITVVPKDFWDAWLKQNSELEAVVNGHVFAAQDRRYGEDEAKDRRDQRTGLEPMQTDRDPRAPKPMSRNLSGITQGDRDAA